MFRILSQSLSFRLLLGFLVPLLLFLSAATVSYFAVQRLMSALERQQIAQETLSQLYDMKASLASMAAAKRGHHLTGDKKFQAEFNEYRNRFFNDVNEIKKAAKDDAATQGKIKAILQLSNEWLKTAEPSFDLWKDQSKFKKEVFLDWFLQWDKAVNLHTGVVLMKRIHEAIDETEQFVRANFNEYRTEVFARTKESTWAILVALLVSIGLGISATQILSRSILKPVHQLKNSIVEMREGNFEAITPYGPKEIAELIRGFNLMGISLAERTMVLETSELRYRTVVGTTSQMLWSTDANGNNVDMADWRSFTGQSDDDLIGDGWLKAVHPDDLERFVTKWHDAVQRKTYSEDEFRIRRADGEYRDFVCRNIPIFDSDEEVREWVRVCVDVTERKQQEEMRRQRDSADAANRAKSEFLAKMSHELRTPLNAIIGMTKMLTTQRFGELNEKQLDYLSDVTQAGEHLLELINDILDLSKVEAGRLELHPEPIHVGEALDHIASTVRTLAEQKELSLESKPPDPDGDIQADLARFRQILFNLVSNAVKFTPEKGKVTIRANWVAAVKREAPMASLGDAKAIRVDVEDTGIGIARKDQKKLGTEFFQADNELTNTQEGTGLGLALTQRLVELMGGEFWFTSDKGAGSTFSFVLPLTAGAEISDSSIESSSSASPARQDAQRPLALIIDDHKPTNKLLADWLDEADIRSVSAFDGKSGINAARRHHPQLILLDVRLPDINGFQVLNKLKSDPRTKDIPIVMVTVLEGKTRPQEIEAVDWFVKPLDKKQLMGRLRKSVPGLFANGHKILIVDDDDSFRHEVRALLEGAGFLVIEATGSETAMQCLFEKKQDLVMLDLFVRQTEGFPLIRRIREQPGWEQLPIVVITNEQLSSEQQEQLNGNIHTIFRQDALSAEALAERLRQIL